MSRTDPRSAYMTTSVMTASPSRLVTLMYEALVSDLYRAEAYLDAQDWFKLNERLLRAQSIVIELRASLRPELWSGGPTLLALYNYLYKLLVRANVRHDKALIAEARRLVEPLSDAWHEAASQLEAETAQPPSMAVGA